MSAQLLVRGSARTYGEIVSVQPDGKQWKYVGLSVIRLKEGTVHQGHTGETEAVLLMIEGSSAIASAQNQWPKVGKRANPFDGPPEAVYLPPNTPYTIKAIRDSEVAICTARAGKTRFPERLLALTTKNAHQRGSGHAQRCIYDVLMDPDGASALFVTEVLTPPGNWSSYPPHKHDQDDPPRESALEELYYYRAMPPSGFAFQRVYTSAEDLNETITARDRDVVLVPRGYHVCAAAAEYAIYYLNVLAGPKHLYHMTFDPAHEWIAKGWTW